MLRRALLTACCNSWPDAGWTPGPSAEVLVGVLASDIRLAVRSLRDYTLALGTPYLTPESRVPGEPTAARVQGPVYVKYNAKTGLCYVTAYTGRDRGVLVQLAQEQVGHFPLGLFDEDRTREAPEGF